MLLINITQTLTDKIKYDMKLVDTDGLLNGLVTFDISEYSINIR